MVRLRGDLRLVDVLGCTLTGLELNGDRLVGALHEESTFDPSQSGSCPGGLASNLSAYGLRARSVGKGSLPDELHDCVCVVMFVLYRSRRSVSTVEEE